MAPLSLPYTGSLPEINDSLLYIVPGPLQLGYYVTRQTDSSDSELRTQNPELKTQNSLPGVSGEGESNQIQPESYEIQPEWLVGPPIVRENCDAIMPNIAPVLLFWILRQSLVSTTTCGP